MLGISSSAQATTAWLVQGLPAIAPQLQGEGGLSLRAVSVLLASALVGMGVAVWPWGLIADRLGERVVIGTGLTVAACALALSAASPGLIWRSGWFCMAGVGAGSANAATGRVVLGWFPHTQRGFAMGLRQASLPIGAALGAATLPFLVRAESVRTALLVTAGLLVVCAGAVAVWLRDPLSTAPAQRTTAPTSVRHGFPEGLAKVVVVSGGLVFVQFGVTAYLVVYLVSRGVSAGAAAAALVALQVAGGVARIAVGALSDRMGDRMAPLRWIALCLAAAFAAVAVCEPLPLIDVVVLLLTAGTLALCWNGLAFTAVAEIAGSKSAGSALGLQNSVVLFTAGTATLAFGWIVNVAGWRLGYLSLSVVALLAFGVASYAPTRKEGQRTAA